MIYLLLSIVALVAGPFLFSLADRRPAAREGLEGFILVTIAGIVFLHIAPEAWRAAGFASAVTGLLGLLFPSLLESIFRQALARAHLVVLALAAAGIFIHAVLDGIALLPLVTETSSAGRELAIGVIVHRLPVGMAIWWVVRPQFGTPLALAIFGLVILTTILGYRIGEDALASSAPVLALFQAFVAGSLIHVALVGASHEHDDGEVHEHDQDGDRLAATAVDKLRSTAYRIGLLIGLVTVFLLPHISA
jgi:zinc transporter ZupT